MELHEPSIGQGVSRRPPQEASAQELRELLWAGPRHSARAASRGTVVEPAVVSRFAVSLLAGKLPEGRTRGSVGSYKTGPFLLYICRRKKEFCLGVELKDMN